MSARQSYWKWIVLCAGLYMIPCVITLFIRKNIPEDDARTFDSGIFVYISQGENVRRLDMEEYLVGVVAAQIPPEYPLEAVKAQAVMARTSVMNVIGDRHLAEATELNQEYFSLETCRQRYGQNFELYYQKLCQAVAETTEEVLTCNGLSVSPVFFKCSSGRTRNAEDVWGSKIPYLTGVDSAADAECLQARTKITMQVEECIKQLKLQFGNFEALPENFKETVQILKKDSAGYVTQIQMGNQCFDGETLRYALDLPSAAFDVYPKTKTITFEVRGIGHGVGLSQWGAKAMAESGKGYRDILAWYFPGTVIG